MGHFAQDCKEKQAKVETNLMKYKIMKTNLRTYFMRRDRKKFFALQDIQETNTICEEMIRRSNLKEQEESSEDEGDESKSLGVSKISAGTPRNKIHNHHHHHRQNSVNRRYKSNVDLNLEACRICL